MTTSTRLESYAPGNIVGPRFEFMSPLCYIHFFSELPTQVILGLGWSFPADVWSAGCIISEIYSGELLFPTVRGISGMHIVSITFYFE